MSHAPLFTKRVFIGFAIAGVILLVAELLSHRHGHFGAVDSWPAFYGIMAVVACTILVIVANALSRLVSRPEVADEDSQPDDLDPDLRS